MPLVDACVYALRHVAYKSGVAASTYARYDGYECAEMRGKMPMSVTERGDDA